MCEYPELIILFTISSVNTAYASYITIYFNGIIDETTNFSLKSIVDVNI